MVRFMDGKKKGRKERRNAFTKPLHLDNGLTCTEPLGLGRISHSKFFLLSVKKHFVDVLGTETCSREN